MKYREMPGTDLCSSTIIMGCDGIGSNVSPAESMKLLDEYVSLGGNHLDTASLYGYPNHASEKCIGQWMLKRGGREKLIITTKGAHPELSTMHISRLSEAEIRSDLEQSLENLCTDYIDLYFLHRDDENVPVSEIMESLNKFIREGKIREIGASNWKPGRISEANAYAKAHGIRGFSASQIKWSYAVMSESFAEDPTLVAMDKAGLEFYEKEQMSVCAFAPQAKGFFSKYAEGKEEALSEKARSRYLCRENIRRFEIARKIAERNCISIGEVVLGYILNQKFPSFPIVGCKNINQLTDSLSAADSEINAEDLKKLIETGNVFGCEK